jgi:nucleoside phosphorylase
VLITQPIQIIFVPQGQEHQAVRRGISEQLSAKKSTNSGSTVPVVVPVPVGKAPFREFLQIYVLPEKPLSVLLIGLCGSLTNQHQVGDVVVYGSCLDETGQRWECDRALTNQLGQVFNCQPVPAFTSDRLIHQAAEKHQIYQKYQTEVVDMEGSSALEVLTARGVAIGMIRIVSDDCQHDLPDLSAAFSPEGSLRPLPLAIGMLRQPLAAARLIQGSLKGLKILQQVSQQLAQSIST